jgi:hypothetical protein
MDGPQMISDAWSRVDKDGSGWVEYDIPNSITGDLRAKSSFVIALDDSNLIGCGAYRSALTAGLAG